MKYPKTEKNKAILILSIGIALATSPMLFSYNNNIAEAQTLIELSPDFATTTSCDVTGCPSVIINVLANDRPAGLSVTAIERQPSNGAAKINADNTITYTPNARFSGIDIFGYTATDIAGNTASTTVTVTVEDRTPPTISNVPAPIRVEATSSSGATVTYPTPTATDNVDASVLVNCVQESGSLFPIGTTPVTCTAIDNAGNTASATFTVTVAPPVTISICHIPPGNPENAHAITVSESDAQNHIRQHGDFVIDSTHPCPPP